MEEKTILIVEDSSLNLKLIRDLLEFAGHSVLEATDGAEGVDMARLHRPDLVIMDIQLPVMDGIQATKVLKEKSGTKNIPIIALTAFAMKGDEERFLNSGFTAYIPKPIDTRRFVEQVEGILKRSMETQEDSSF